MPMGNRCTCGAAYVIDWAQSRDSYDNGFRIVCPICGKTTHYWKRMSDALLEWEQVTDGSEQSPQLRE